MSGMVTLGLSTWSLHRSLESKSVDLLDVPKEMRRRGLTDLQICHFQIPSRDASYLTKLKARIAEANVTLDALLIDVGDLAGDAAARDGLMMREWVDVAATLGARYARVSAGKQAPTSERITDSAKRLLSLGRYGEKKSVKVITENWQELMPSSKEVLELMKLTEGKIPLCLDFGNWSGPGKYEELEAIAPDAVTVHAKCAFLAEGQPDAADFRKCLEILRDSDFEGTIALIYDGASPDEWGHLEIERNLVREVFPA